MQGKKAIADARVSTNPQAAEDKVSHDKQLSFIREWAQREGYRIVEELKEVVSGATDLDPEHKELRPLFWGAWDKLKRGEVDAIIFWEPTRFCRDARMDGVKFAYWFLESRKYGDGIRLTIAEPPREGDQAAILTFLQGFQAAQEYKNIARRMQTTKAAYFDMGRLPQGKLPPGYIYNKGAQKVRRVKRIVEVVKLIFKLYCLEGLSMAKVSERLRKVGIPTSSVLRGYKKGKHATESWGKVWSIDRISDILGTEAYATGILKMPYCGKVYNIKVPKIISRALFDQAQYLRRTRKRVRFSGEKALLSGRMGCGLCPPDERGRPRPYYRGTWWHPTKKATLPAYYCKGRSQTFKRVQGGLPCEHSPILFVEATDALIWRRFKRLLGDEEGLRRAAEHYLARLEEQIASIDLAGVDERIKDLEGERERCLRAWVKFEGDPKFYEDEIARVDKELGELRARVEEQRETRAKLENLRAAKGAVESALRNGLLCYQHIREEGNTVVVRGNAGGMTEEDLKAYEGSGLQQWVGVEDVADWTPFARRWTKTQVLDMFQVGVIVYPDRLELTGVVGDSIRFPDSSRIIESWDMARFSSRTDSRMAGTSETPQNFLGSRRLRTMTKGMKP